MRSGGRFRPISGPMTSILTKKSARCTLAGLRRFTMRSVACRRMCYNGHAEQFRCGTSITAVHESKHTIYKPSPGCPTVTTWTSVCFVCMKGSDQDLQAATARPPQLDPAVMHPVCILARLHANMRSGCRSFEPHPGLGRALDSIIKPFISHHPCVAVFGPLSNTAIL